MIIQLKQALQDKIVGLATPLDQNVDYNFVIWYIRNSV